MRDPDDWFVELEPPPPRREERGEPVRDLEAGEDDWLGDGAAARAAELPFGLNLSNRWVAVVAGILLLACLLVGGLVLGGVFAGSKHPRAATTPAAPVTQPVTTSPATTATTPASTVQPPTATLKPGDTGTQVTALQRALAHLGYSVGKVDGNYGTATKSAVALFQTSAKLTADGIVGPATLAALVSALHGP